MATTKKTNGAKAQPKTTANTNDHKGAMVAGIIGMAAATAAGAYFLYGTPDGKKVKKQIRGWALKAKGEVLEKMEILKDVNEDTYHQVIDGVLKRYKTIKGVDTAELASIAKELKGHWGNIRKELEASAKKVIRAKEVATKAKTNAKKVAK